MLKLPVFSYSDNSEREKDCSCRKRGTQATRARQGDLARVTRAWQRQPFSRTACSHSSSGSFVESAPLASCAWYSRGAKTVCVLLTTVTLACVERTRAGTHVDIIDLAEFVSECTTVCLPLIPYIFKSTRENRCSYTRGMCASLDQCEAGKLAEVTREWQASHFRARIRTLAWGTARYLSFGPMPQCVVYTHVSIWYQR